MEAKKSFTEASTLQSQEKLLRTSTTQEVDPSVLATFMKTYMKLLHDRKAVEGLEELINKCESKAKIPIEQRTVRRIGKHKK